MAISPFFSPFQHLYRNKGQYLLTFILQTFIVSSAAAPAPNGYNFNTNNINDREYVNSSFSASNNSSANSSIFVGIQGFYLLHKVKVEQRCPGNKLEVEVVETNITSGNFGQFIARQHCRYQVYGYIRGSLGNVKSHTIARLRDDYCIAFEGSAFTSSVRQCSSS